MNIGMGNMKRKLGDIFGALFIIGIILILIGFVLSYIPVPERYLIKYVDNDHNGIAETPVYGVRYVNAFGPIGAYIFITGFIFSISGAVVMINVEKGSDSPEEPYARGQKYTVRMPPPYWENKP